MPKYAVTPKSRVNEGADLGSVELGVCNNSTSKNDLVDYTYDPYASRTVRLPTSFSETLIHLLKASLGTGILSMPVAFKNSGYVIGILGTIVIGILSTYMIHLLIQSSYELCVKKRVPSLTYSETVAAAFEEGPLCTRWMASYARTLTDWFLVVYQVGSSIIYIIFIGQNLQMVINAYFEVNIEEKWYQLFLFIPMVLISLIRSLKHLAPFSSIATAFSLISFICVFYYIFREPMSMENRVAVGSGKTMPLFFGTVLFAMEAVGVILPLENEMAHPRRFTSMFGVLNISFVPITILYCVVGLFGYIKYGENVKDTITLSIPKNEMLSGVTKILLSISIYFGYALSNYVAFDILWSKIKNLIVDNRIPNIYFEYMLRIVIVCITFLLAFTLPYLNILISLMGSLCLSAVGIAIPAIVNYLTFFKSYEKGTWRYYLFIARNLVIVLIAVYALVVGVYQNILEIMEKVANSK
ncbi:Amino acid transporter, transmembrane domain [Cinara cedri]|uniref:Amino acid transporter, transmembrane domain n=1 Tax=Cinara cedri TaxID=506608 RepID=A0A5E4N101_9HEMI|nr:Amino acid transporter, transmembrane domain [Cinara cedri]